jgi:hypothetical protein
VSMIMTDFLTETSGPAGLTRGQIQYTDAILTKAQKYVELCDGPVYPDFEEPPGARLFGEEASYTSHRYGGDAFTHCEY